MIVYPVHTKQFIAHPHRRLNLSYWDPDDTTEIEREQAEKQLVRLEKVMSNLQYRLYIESKRSLLIILQGMDTSGKDGTIRHVIKAFNPAGCFVKAFNAPTEEELIFYGVFIGAFLKGDLLVSSIDPNMKM